MSILAHHMVIPGPLPFDCLSLGLAVVELEGKTTTTTKWKIIQKVTVKVDEIKRTLPWILIVASILLKWTMSDMTTKRNLEITECKFLATLPMSYTINYDRSTNVATSSITHRSGPTFPRFLSLPLPFDPCSWILKNSRHTDSCIRAMIPRVSPPA